MTSGEATRSTTTAKPIIYNKGTALVTGTSSSHLGATEWSRYSYSLYYLQPRSDVPHVGCELVGCVLVSCDLMGCVLVGCELVDCPLLGCVLVGFVVVGCERMSCVLVGTGDLYTGGVCTGGL